MNKRNSSDAFIQRPEKPDWYYRIKLDEKINMAIDRKHWKWGAYTQKNKNRIKYIKIKNLTPKRMLNCEIYEGHEKPTELDCICTITWVITK